MSWYCYIAFKQLFPSGKGLSLFSALSIMGVAIGVWMLVVVISVMDGFLVETKAKLIALNGHIKIDQREIMRDYDPLVDELLNHPDVAAVSPYAEGIVMVTQDQYREYPIVRGYDSMNPEPVVPLQDYLIDGSVEDLVDWSVILGDKLAHKLDVTVGDTLTLFTPLIMERLKSGEVLLPESLEVAGIFSTGYSQVDEHFVLVTLRKMQDLYALGTGVHGLSVRLHPKADTQFMAQALRDTLPPQFWAYTWLEENNDFYTALETHKAMMYFILIAISVVAAFSIAISLLTSVLRKTREIGIYASMGATRTEVAWIYSLQGLFIGVVGTGLGMLIAVVFLHFRNELVGLFARVTGSRDILVQFYQFDVLPIHYSMSDILIIIFSALLISTMAGLLPALRAAWLQPARALRSE